MESRDLNGRQNTTDNQTGRDKILLVVVGQMGSTGTTEDKRWSDDTCQHGQGMLKTEYKGEKYGHFVVEAKEWASKILAAHERDIGLEEETIVCHKVLELQHSSLDGIEAYRSRQ
jgi:hypothetical protein